MWFTSQGVEKPSGGRGVEMDRGQRFGVKDESVVALDIETNLGNLGCSKSDTYFPG